MRDKALDYVRVKKTRLAQLWAEGVRTRAKIAKLREALHDLLGPYDGRDPETNERISLETTGVAVRAAQAVLATGE